MSIEEFKTEKSELEELKNAVKFFEEMRRSRGLSNHDYIIYKKTEREFNKKALAFIRDKKDALKC